MLPGGEGRSWAAQGWARGLGVPRMCARGGATHERQIWSGDLLDSITLRPTACPAIPMDPPRDILKAAQVIKVVKEAGVDIQKLSAQTHE